MNPAKLVPGAAVGLNLNPTHRRRPTRDAMDRLERSLGVVRAEALLAGRWTFLGWVPVPSHRGPLTLAHVSADGYTLLVHHQDLRAVGREDEPWRRGPQAHPVATRAALLQGLVAGPVCGHALIERVREMTDGAVDLDQGAVYPALRALERDGLTRSVERPAHGRGGKPQRVHELTPQGWSLVRRDRALMTALMGAPLPATQAAGGG